MRRVSISSCCRIAALVSGAVLHKRHYVSNTIPSTNDSADAKKIGTSQRVHGGNATSVPLGPYRRVGNIFIVLCVDHPFKFSWEINHVLRSLRLEYMGQTVIHPDIPEVRRLLWRVRHVVRVDMLDLDEAKAMVGIPEHINFSDLSAQIPPTFGRGKAYSSPVMRSKANFMRLRRMRLRDVVQRDELEKQLLEERRRLVASNGTVSSDQSGDGLQK